MIFLEEHCVLFFQSKWSESNAKDRLKQASGKHENSLIITCRARRMGWGKRKHKRLLARVPTSFFSVYFQLPLKFMLFIHFAHTGARSLPALFCQIKLMGRKNNHTDALNPRLILQSFGSCIWFLVWFKNNSGDTRGTQKGKRATIFVFKLRAEFFI